MRVLGVIDLLGGRAVHAAGGDRAGYEPLHASGGVRIQGDPTALAGVYRERFGIRELYVADLDGIGGRPGPPETLGALASLGMPIWLDAGASSVDAAHAALAGGASRAIVGLETLTSFTALAEIARELGSERVAFSLDLRDGVPLCPGGIDEDSPEGLATRAVEAGAGAILAIDLRRVGSGRGADVSLLGRVRRSAPGAVLLAGGGVKAPADLKALADAGCDGILLATALHRGTIEPSDLAGYIQDR